MEKKLSIGKRMLAFVLTFAMVFTAISWGELGGVKAEAAETMTVELKDADFTGDLENDGIWTIDASATDSNTTAFVKYTYADDQWMTPPEGSASGFKFWMKAGGTLLLTQTIEDLPTGTYKVSSKVMGLGADVSVKLGDNTGDAVSLTGYNTWDDVTGTFEVASDLQNVEIGFSVQINADGYGYIDYIALEKVKSVELQDAYFTGDLENDGIWTIDASSTDSATTAFVKYTYADDEWMTPPEGSASGFKFWMKAGGTLLLTQTIEDLPTGTYKVSSKVMGLGADVSVKLGDNTGDAVSLTGYNTWDDVTGTFEVASDLQNVEIGFSVQINADGYGYIDYIALEKTTSTGSTDNDNGESDDEDDVEPVVGLLNIDRIKNLDDNFIMGMDISSMISEIQSGVVYKDYSGTALYENSDTLQDKLNKTCKFLSDNGVTDIRIRVWNDPYNSSGNGYGGGNNDVAKAKMFADAARYAGLKMMVDFHCSDFWCDPGKQKAPKAWAEMSLEDKETALQSFITESLTAIDVSKDVVTKVQVGNETTSGFVGETDKVKMCTLYKAGIKGVENYNKDVETVIHLTNPEKQQMTSWAATLNTNNVDYDILATSYYPYWHGTFENLQSEFNKVQTTYGKKCMVAETSYAYTLDETDGHENTVRVGNNDTSTNWPFTVQGQATYMRDVMNAVNEAGGLGVFYWESAWITVGDTTGLSEDALDDKTNANKLLWEQYGSGWASSYSAEYDPNDAGRWYGGSAVDNQAFFATDGTALNSLYVYQYVYTGAETNEIEIQEIDNPSVTCYLGDAISLPGQVTVKFNKGDVAKTVKWSGTPSSKKVGTYTINGTITLNSDEVPNQGTYAGCMTIPTTFTYEVKHTNLLNAGVAGFSVADAYVTSDSALNTYDLKTNDVVEAGNPVMHWYDGSNAIDGFAITKDEIKLSAGTYCLSAETQGEKGAVQLQIVDAEEQIVAQSESVACEGWHVFKYPSVSFTLAEEKNIRIKILVTGEASSWGTVDNLYLYDVNATEYVAPAPDNGSNNGNGGSSPNNPPSYNTTPSAPVTSESEKTDSTTPTTPDGTTTETKTETTTNESGKEVETTVTTQKDADGKVTGSTEVSTIANVAKNTEVTVTVEKDADGKVAEAAAEVTRKGAETKTGTKGTIAGAVVDQIKEAAGTADIAITTSVTDAKGKEKYSVTVNAGDLVAGEKLTVVVKDEKTGKTVLVDAKQIKVTVNGGVNVVLPEGKDYTLIDAKEAAKVTKEILKTVAPVKTSATLKEGKKATAKLSKKLDMDNVKKITYVSSKKSVATVDQNGKVTAKKAGTVIISIKVTLNNGTTKTVKMKYKIK